MLNLDDFAALQRRVERARRERDQAAGAAAQLRERLAAEFGAADTDAAAAKLAKLQARELALAEEYADRKEQFLAKFAEQLGEK